MLARARVGQKARAFRQQNEHSIVSTAAAFGMGFGERKGWDFPTIPKVDPKLTYGAAALVVSLYVKGERPKRFARSAADGLLGAWAYEAGKSGEFGVGGDEDIDV